VDPGYDIVYGASAGCICRDAWKGGEGVKFNIATIDRGFLKRILIAAVRKIKMLHNIS
jgi:hypothetical protein